MAARRGPPGLGRDRVVAAALEELDGSGLDHLTMRGVAARLGVRLNTVYWHARSKPELIDLMADALLEGAAREPLPAPWTDRLRVLATRYRDALLARRDGARVVHLAGGSHPHTDAFTEALLETLAAAGLDERGAGWGGPDGARRRGGCRRGPRRRTGPRRGRPTREGTVPARAPSRRAPGRRRPRRPVRVRAGPAGRRPGRAGRRDPSGGRGRSRPGGSARPPPAARRPRRDR